MFKLRSVNDCWGLLEVRKDYKRIFFQYFQGENNFLDVWILDCCLQNCEGMVFIVLNCSVCGVWLRQFQGSRTVVQFCFYWVGVRFQSCLVFFIIIFRLCKVFLSVRFLDRRKLRYSVMVQFSICLYCIGFYIVFRTFFQKVDEYKVMSFFRFFIVLFYLKFRRGLVVCLLSCVFGKICYIYLNRKLFVLLFQVFQRFCIFLGRKIVQWLQVFFGFS